MERNKEDRRVRRTRQLIQDALISLLKEKRYEDISVQDVIERADIARSTFYVHYKDKDDLLVGDQGIFVRNLGHDAILSWDKENQSAFPAYIWFQHIQAQEATLKIIAKDPALELAMKTMRGIIRHAVQLNMQDRLKQGENAAIPPMLVMDYLADTFMSLTRWWLDQDKSPSPERMGEIFEQCQIVIFNVPDLASNGKCFLMDKFQWQ